MGAVIVWQFLIIIKRLQVLKLWKLNLYNLTAVRTIWAVTTIEIVKKVTNLTSPRYILTAAIVKSGQNYYIYNFAAVVNICDSYPSVTTVQSNRQNSRKRSPVLK